MDIDYELFTNVMCLLSSFQSPLLNLLMIIVKRRIFFAKLNLFPLFFVDMVSDFKRHRDLHKKQMACGNNAEKLFINLWKNLAYDDDPFETTIAFEHLLHS